MLKQREKPGQRLHLQCDLALIPDSGSITEVTAEEKGVLHLKVTASGIDGHSARPWLAQNAVDRLLAFYHDMTRLFDDFAKTEDHWHPTCSLTVLNTPNRMTNRIPAKAVAGIDIRFPPPFQSKTIVDQIKEITDENIQVDVLLCGEPCRFEPDPAYLDVTEKVTGQKPKLSNSHGASDARFFCQAEIPVILSRPEVGNLHTAGEWVGIESLKQLYMIYYQYTVQRLGLVKSA